MKTGLLPLIALKEFAVTWPVVHARDRHAAAPITQSVSCLSHKHCLLPVIHLAACMCTFTTWAAWYNNWLLIELTPKGAVLSFLFCTFTPESLTAQGGDRVLCQYPDLCHFRCHHCWQNLRWSPRQQPSHSDRHGLCLGCGIVASAPGKPFCTSRLLAGG